MKVSQSKEELKSQLQEQIQFLKASSSLYDAGFENEAKRLAVTLRVLLSDTKNSKSLLTVLELKDKLFFYDWINEMEKGTVHRTMIGVIGTAHGIKFMPSFPINSYKKVTFEEWWNRIVVFDKSTIISFDRGEIIRSVADMDGGAHVDAKINETYYKLSRNQVINVRDGKGNKPINSPALALIRQFAYEVYKSFEDQRSVWEVSGN